MSNTLAVKNCMDQSINSRANKICSSKQAFQQQIYHIKTLTSRNAYPKCAHNSITYRLKSNINRNDNINNNKDDRKAISINIPYLFHI